MLAKRALLVLTKGAVPWMDFASAYECMRVATDEGPLGSYASLQHFAVNSLRPVKTNYQTWPQALEKCRGTFCTECNDRIYACNGLVPSSSRITVDYDRDRFDLFFQIAQMPTPNYRSSTYGDGRIGYYVPLIAAELGLVVELPLSPHPDVTSPWASETRHR